MPNRCDWVKEPIHEKYHDIEWGVPIHDDYKLFEFLILDGAQAGLSWSMILKRREEYRKAFDNFNPEKISKYKNKDIQRLLNTPEIIRNKKKIESFVNNSKRFLDVQEEFKTFDKYIWKFVNNKTITNAYEKWSDIPSSSNESQKMSDDLKNRGFTFVGPTICYAFMQTTGMVNDHIVSCFRRKQIKVKRLKI